MTNVGDNLVIGLGVTGLAVVRFLAARGESVRVADSRPQPPGLVELQQDYPHLAVHCGELSPALLAGVSRVIASPGVALNTPILRAAIAANIPVIGDIELFAQHANAPIIAVTGSNGKSTVVTLLGEMAEAAKINARIGGNLGTPALDLLADDVALYVLELSSFQLETTHSLAAHTACVLNVSPDHLDRYANLGEYAVAKARIYKNCATPIINADDVVAAKLLPSVKTAVSFGVQNTADFQLVEHAGAAWLAQQNTPLLAVAELKLAGKHNWANALAALALGAAAGLPMTAMLAALQDFTGLAHRTQFVAERLAVRWYNDSKATNVGATLAAIEGFEQPLVLIAGGQAKGGDFQPLATALANKARAVVLLGEDAALLEQAIQNVTTTVRVADMQAAVNAAADYAQPGDAVLLSPACASFDQFAGYAARGEAFATAVQELAA